MKNYLLTIVSILFLSAFTFGATFTVNSSADTGDTNPSDNLCLDASGNCTLRAAIEQANASASNDEINFAANVSSISLATQITITNNGSLTITGRGANLLKVTNISGDGRAFQSDAVTLIITDLTVSGNIISSRPQPTRPAVWECSSTAARQLSKGLFLMTIVISTAE